MLRRSAVAAGCLHDVYSYWSRSIKVSASNRIFHTAILVAAPIIQSHRVAAQPNPSLEPTCYGSQPWPRYAVLHDAPRGQGRLPPPAAQLKR